MNEQVLKDCITELRTKAQQLVDATLDFPGDALNTRRYRESRTFFRLANELEALLTI